MDSERGNEENSRATESTTSAAAASTLLTSWAMLGNVRRMWPGETCERAHRLPLSELDMVELEEMEAAMNMGE